MKVTLLYLGKTSSTEIKSLCREYEKRISRYVKIEEAILDNSAIKAGDRNVITDKEGELILKKLLPSDYVVLLDDKGKEFTSLQFSSYIQSLMNQSYKSVYFIVGGAYGFSDAVYKRANAKVSLSKMTFSHQIIRVIFAEQLYRAFAIINNEPYHHE
ncbi:MAG: 23S rRNA (pseudouridine(1915)-N(3))-methyltransferase RlmH [Chitinophagales bacterium]